VSNIKHSYRISIVGQEKTHTPAPLDFLETGPIPKNGNKERENTHRINADHKETPGASMFVIERPAS